MPKDPGKPSGSPVLLDEYFAQASDAFLPHLRTVSDLRKLASFADRWKSDPRPWARQKIFDYLSAPLSSPGHNPLVKRLFKHAAQSADHELMGAFLHAFDLLVRRVRGTKHEWDPASRIVIQHEVLVAPRDTVVPPKGQQLKNPTTGQPVSTAPRRRPPEHPHLFTYRTRYYLRRRVWRHFRHLGHKHPGDYRTAIAAALARYTDADLARGENILDSWCLLNICYHDHPALTFTPTKVRLNEGRSLNDLTPAPKFPEIWSDPAAAEVLWKLLPAADSRLVRLWTMGLLRQHHAAFLSTLTPTMLRPLFESIDDDVQQFAAEALASAPGLDKLPNSAWLDLLTTRDAGALAAIARIMAKHVTPDRLTLPQLIALANSSATPVARLGLDFLRSRKINSPADRLTLSDLADARSQALAPELTTYALSILGTPDHYDVSLVSRFFDSLLPATRTAAWAWLTETSPGHTDPALWSRLVETPYEDVRLRLVKVLESRKSLPGARTDTLVPIWSSVLLGIHRGGRHKISALHQISRALLDHPDAAQTLLPVMSVAVRSVRPPEARVGLAAVIRAVEREPSLAPAVSSTFPELSMISQGATA